MSRGIEETAPWCRDSRGRSYTYDEFVGKVEEFHGYAAPGLVLGGLMVALALDALPGGVLFDAICETSSCLPDAIQLLTPCTLGNGWLRIHDTGRFALTLFDKETGGGVRVAVQADRLEPWPDARAFFFKLVPKKQQDSDTLLNELRRAGPALCAVTKVRVRPEVRRKIHAGPVAVCPGCGEGFPVRHGERCRACQGNTYFDR
jgi:formylmethanofuran dehydrogenase subunit E